MFVRVIGPLGAVRALATLPVIATPLAMLYARRRLHGDASPTYGYLGVALSFGFMTLIGFASYLLGVAVMLFGLVMWLELLVAADDGRTDLRKRELVMAAFAPLIFVAHGHAFALFLLCAAVSRGRARVAGRRACSASARSCRRSGSRGGSRGLSAGRRRRRAPCRSCRRSCPCSRARRQVRAPRHADADDAQRDRLPRRRRASGSFAAACTFYTRALARQGAEARRSCPEPRHSRALYASARRALRALPRAAPRHRVVRLRRRPPPAAHPDARPARRAARGAPSSARAGRRHRRAGRAAALATVALVASYFFQREARGYREVLARVPAQATLLNLPLDPNSDVFTGHPFIHYDKLVLADRPVVVSDVWFHQGSALYPTKDNPALRLPASYSESDLKFIEWPAYHLEDWEFVLIRTRPTAPQPYTPNELALEEHVGGWWLFKHAPAPRRADRSSCAPRRASCARVCCDPSPGVSTGVDGLLGATLARIRTWIPTSFWTAALVQTVFLVALAASDGYDVARSGEAMRVVLTYATVFALFGIIHLAVRPDVVASAHVVRVLLFVTINFARFETAGSFDYGFAHENVRELSTPLGRHIVLSNVRPWEVGVPLPHAARERSRARRWPAQPWPAGSRSRAGVALSASPCSSAFRSHASARTSRSPGSSPRRCASTPSRAPQRRRSRARNSLRPRVGADAERARARRRGQPASARHPPLHGVVERALLGQGPRRSKDHAGLRRAPPRGPHLRSLLRQLGAEQPRPFHDALLARPHVPRQGVRRHPGHAPSLPA